MSVPAGDAMPADAAAASDASGPIGLLFDEDYDALAHRRLDDDLDLRRAGFDLLSLGGPWRLAGFDFARFADRMARRAQREGWQAVVSHHEFAGALVAALVSDRLGLPGTPPAAVLACQHKLHARAVLARVAPQANPVFLSVDAGPMPDPSGWPFPCYLKPVRSTLSVLAFRLESARDLERLWPRGRVARWAIRRLIAPFDRIGARHLPGASSASAFLVESVLPGTQHNLDGWVDARGVHPLGIVDAAFYPGTQAFSRWHYPSRLPADTHHRALAIARVFLTEIGFTRGFFNMEFVVDERGEVRVLEFNPRLASQFGDLYRWVDGVDPHRMAIELACGREIDRTLRVAPSARVAASLVWRSFGRKRPAATPASAARATLARSLPLSSLVAYPALPGRLAQRQGWTDSDRYGVVNLGADDPDQLRERCGIAARCLGWPDAPYGEASYGGASHTEAPYTDATKSDVPQADVPGASVDATPAARRKA